MAFLDRLKLFPIATSFGGIESLPEHTATISYRERSDCGGEFPMVWSGFRSDSKMWMICWTICIPHRRSWPSSRKASTSA